MEKKFKLFVLSLIVLLTLGFVKTYGQISLTGAEVRKINETFARLDSAHAQGRLVLRELKTYQDSTKLFRDSTFYWKSKALTLKKRRNNWRWLSAIEAAAIAIIIRLN